MQSRYSEKDKKEIENLMMLLNAKTKSVVNESDEPNNNLTNYFKVIVNITFDGLINSGKLSRSDKEKMKENILNSPCKHEEAIKFDKNSEFWEIIKKNKGPFFDLVINFVGLLFSADRFSKTKEIVKKMKVTDKDGKEVFDFENRLNRIKTLYELHSNFDLPNDKKKALKKIVEAKLYIDNDQASLVELIEDIKRKIKNLNDMKEASEGSIVSSGFKIITGIAGMFIAPGQTFVKILNGVSAAFNTASIVIDIGTLVTANNAIDELEKFLKEAEELNKEISEKIKELQSQGNGIYDEEFKYF